MTTTHTLVVTSHNSNDPECRRLSVTRHYPINGQAADLPGIVADLVRDNEDLLKRTFPRNMSYTVPYTEVDVFPTPQEEPTS